MKRKLHYTLLTTILLLLPTLVYSGDETETISADLPSPTHEEVESIGMDPQIKFGNLTTFCMDRKGNLLACDSQKNEIRTISPKGKPLARWKFDFAPNAVHACPDGTIYAAGAGKVAKIDETGKVLKIVETDSNDFPAGKPSGITATKRDVFVCIGSSWSVRSRSSIVRFDRELGEPNVIAEDLRGCCQRLDIVAKDGVLYVAENSRYRILKCDRDGNILSKWGERDRKDIKGFGSCCNPMNFCFGPKGDLYTAESGLGRIKRYSPDGEFIDLVGYVGVERFSRRSRLAASCSNITVAVNKDESRIYVLDFKNNIIRVMGRASTEAGTEPNRQCNKASM
ncbi:MAG: NHL repeat-containing protein [Planctomycetota bacterium]|jgi:sugar lactone lactonase YvrE